jgi:Trk K+ transport system NAD-binding subunit
MDNLRRRSLYYGLILLGSMLAFTVVYDYGMAAFEDDPKDFLQSMQFVVETFTTTGYGSHSPWTNPEMNLLVIVMDLAGMVLIFAALPVLAVPLFEEAFSTSLPTEAPDEVEDHVVICTFTPRGETLVEELDSWDVDHVVVEPDRDRATDLFEAGYTVINDDPESIEALERARLPVARALVADASDQVNTSIVLTGKEIAADVRAVSLVEEPSLETYHRLAGADTVLSPRSLLGRGLATKVTTGVSTELGDTVEVGDDFEIAELSIHRGSELVGETIAESALRDRTGANVIGVWFRGQFETPPSPDTPLDPGTVLLVTGREDQLAALKELTRSDVRRVGRGETLVVGNGEVGRSVSAQLAAADLSHTVVDLEDEDDVDVVGDATDPDEMEAAGVGDARTVVLALPDDTVTEFATLVVRDLNPDLEIIARTEETENVAKLYRAGADYVLSLATVSGRMLASTLLEEEQIVSPDTQVEVVRTRASELAGRTLHDADVRSRTGCTVVAVERDGEVVTDVGPSFRVRAGDELVVAGPADGIGQFTQLLN